MVESTVREAIRRFSWYHRIEVQPGVVTPGIQELLPIQRPIMNELRRHDLSNKRVLDVGCRDGLFSFEAEKMNAAEVVAIDNDPSRGAVELLAPFFRSKVKFQEVNLYDFVSNEKFDFIIFAGVLYHLRFPFVALRQISQVLRLQGILLLETAVWATPSSIPALYCPAPNESPYEPTSVTFFNNAGLIANLTAFGFSQIECRHILAGDCRTFSSWSDFFSSNSWHPSSERAEIVRGVYVATKSIEQDEVVSKYWSGLHKLNSDLEKAKAFLAEHGYAWPFADGEVE
jgi:SAM-dependent methyltransferase